MEENKIPTQDITPATDLEELEREAYGEKRHKSVQKLRKKGLQYGVTVPYCTKPLIKPQKKRPLMLATMYVCLGATAILVVLTILLLIKANYFKAFGQVLKALGGTLDKDVVSKTLGFSALASASFVIVLIVMILILILPIVVVMLLLSHAKTLNQLAGAPRQEIAVGYKIKNTIKIVIIWAIVVLAGFVFGITQDFFSNTNGIIAMVILTLGFLTLVLYAIALILTRKKEKEWFDTLPKDAQDDYIAHNDALEKLSHKK